MVEKYCLPNRRTLIKREEYLSRIIDDSFNLTPHALNYVHCMKQSVDLILNRNSGIFSPVTIRDIIYHHLNLPNVGYRNIGSRTQDEVIEKIVKPFIALYPEISLKH